MYTDKELSAMNGLNPPIRGSIDFQSLKAEERRILYQSPYKGFNRNWKRRRNIKNSKQNCINPPIRGSIEQDNALFENYSHKR